MGDDADELDTTEVAPSLRAGEMGGINDVFALTVFLRSNDDVEASFSFEEVLAVESGVCPEAGPGVVTCSKGFCGATEAECEFGVDTAAIFAGSATEPDEEWVVVEAASAADVSDME